MAFTPEEEARLKKMSQRRQLLKDIDTINATAGTDRQAKIDEANAIEAQRRTDVRAKRDAITALDI